MKFDLEKSFTILTRTPNVIKTLLEDIDDDWTSNNEGGESWSPFDVVGHLIHNEKTDWIPRAMIILYGKAPKAFEPFNRFAQFQDSKGKSLQELLNEFEQWRIENLSTLKGFQLTEKALDLEGFHPEFGKVSLRQLLSAWVVHDLGHLNQISRVMAKQYTIAVGPWINYMKVLHT